MVLITARENVYNALASARDGDGRFARSLEEASQLVHAFETEIAVLHSECVASAFAQGRKEALELLRGALGDDVVDKLINGGTIEIEPLKGAEVMNEEAKEMDDEGSVEAAEEDGAAAGDSDG